MMRQLGEYTARLQSTAAQNEQLQAEIDQLRAFITVRGASLLRLSLPMTYTIPCTCHGRGDAGHRPWGIRSALVN